jgi:uncharacterized protein (AIM24 family)
MRNGESIFVTFVQDRGPARVFVHPCYPDHERRAVSPVEFAAFMKLTSIR